MREYIWFFLWVLLPAIGFAQAQAPHIEWARCFGGADDETALAIEQTSDKGFIIAGDSYSFDGDVTAHHDFGNDNADYWIVKLDSMGKLQWQKALGGDSDDVATSIKQTPDGGYIVAGYSNSINGDVTGNHGGKDYWVVKLDMIGKIQWEKSYGGSKDDVASSIEFSSNGGFVIAGTSFSNDNDVSGHHGSTDSSDCWIINIDSTGKLLWEISLGNTGNDRANDIKRTWDNGYVIAAYLAYFSTLPHFTTIKIDSAGKFLLEHLFGGSGTDEPFNIEVTRERHIILTGTSNSGPVTGNHGGQDVWALELDSSGDPVWQHAFGGTGDEAAYSIKQTFDTGYIIAGYTNSHDGDVTNIHSPSEGTNDYWIIKLDSAGKIQWQKTLGGSSDDFGYCIRQTSDSGFIVAGSTDSGDGDVIGHHFHQDYWIVKLGDHPVNAVNSTDARKELSIYPNPFSQRAEIEFGELLDAPSDLIIYNILGAQMRRIKIGEMQENVIINRDRLPEGVYYFHHVVNGMIIEQGKIVVSSK